MIMARSKICPTKKCICHLIFKEAKVKFLESKNVSRKGMAKIAKNKLEKNEIKTSFGKQRFG